MSTAQILKPLFGKHLKQRKIVGFDVETYGKNNLFYMGGIYDEDGYKAFYDKDELIRELLNKKYYGNVYVTATNLAFDFTVTYFNTKNWNFYDLIMRGSDLICATHKLSGGRKNGQKITFIDTLNYAGFGVKAMGGILKIPKLETPVCIINDEKGYARKPKNKEEKEELEIYNKRDCEITYEFMKFLQSGFAELGGKTKLTSASTSMDIFRRKYLRKSIVKEDYVLQRKPEDTIHEFIFESYYGGRTEVFKRGLINHKLKAYDINSLYPSVMLNHYPHPESVKLSNSPTISMIQFEGISEVTVYAPYMEYPILPCRSEEKLTFPTGLFRGVYTHIELRKAIEKGYKIVKMYKTLWYKRNFFPFKTYVTDLYNKRLEFKKINSPMELVTKLLMNSLYGKFGQRKMTDSQIIDFQSLSEEETRDFKNNEYATETKDGRFILMNKPKECYKPFVIPIFASYTTAMARLKLHGYLEKYGAYYCDTDSCFTRKSMPESSKIGAMKLEYDIKKAILVKPKMYMLHYNKPDKWGNTEKVRLKGVRNLTVNGFNDVLNGKEVHYDKFSKLKESVRRALIPNTILDVTKKISLEDNKRKWEKSFSHLEKQESEPLHFRS